MLGPLVLGSSAALGAWAMEARSGVGIFAFTAGALGSLGALFTRALVGGPALRSAIQEEMIAAERRRHEGALDQLDAVLAKIDNDPRPEAALRDLRTLLAAFEELSERSENCASPESVEVLSQVRQLGEASVASLRETLELQQIVARLHSPSAAAPLLAERERLVLEVQSGVRQLGRTLAALPAVGPDSTVPELRRLRSVLDDSLATARQSAQRLEQMLAPAPGAEALPATEFSRSSVNTQESSKP